MTRRSAIKLLRTEPRITCLDQRSYLNMLALKIELAARDLHARLAELELHPRDCCKVTR